MDATTRRMLREAGLKTPEQSSCSEYDDSDNAMMIEQRLQNPTSQKAHYEATLDRRLKKALKQERVTSDKKKNEIHSSPIINFKEVFEQFGEHLKPECPMSNSDDGGDVFSKLVKDYTSEDQSEVEREQKKFMETQREMSKNSRKSMERKVEVPEQKQEVQNIEDTI